MVAVATVDQETGIWQLKFAFREDERPGRKGREFSEGEKDRETVQVDGLLRGPEKRGLGGWRMGA